MQQRKKSRGNSKEGGAKKSRAAKVVAPVAELEQVADTVPAADTAFPADKPDYIRMHCNRCGKRLTLKSQNPGTPGLGPYQGYCRFPCGIEYIVQVNLIG